MHHEQVDVICVQSFQTLLRPGCKIGASSRGKLGYQKNLLAGIRITNEPVTDALLAAAAAVSLRGVPVVDSPIERFSKHQTIVQDVEHAAQ